jgi:ferredoxin
MEDTGAHQRDMASKQHRNRRQKGTVMAKQVWVDKDECISCGLCIENLPEVFRSDDDGKAECYDSAAATEEDIENNAIEICPVSCIHWKE